MAKPSDELPVRMPAHAAPTRASSAYDRLHDDILTGALKPGEKLRLKDLIDRYQTGNSPLREALNRLSAKGMVVREENRGFRVPPAKKDELLELTKTRCWLEEIGLRESIKHGDSEWEERIVLSFHRLKRASSGESAGDDSQFMHQWEAVHQDFHMALISACRSDILIRYCAELHQRSYRYRNLAEVVEYRGIHEQDEHQALQNAALSRDANKAAELLRKHYEVTAKILIDSGRFD